MLLVHLIIMVYAHGQSHIHSCIKTCVHIHVHVCIVCIVVQCAYLELLINQSNTQLFCTADWLV